MQGRFFKNIKEIIIVSLIFWATDSRFRMEIYLGMDYYWLLQTIMDY